MKTPKWFSLFFCKYSSINTSHIFIYYNIRSALTFSEILWRIQTWKKNTNLSLGHIIMITLGICAFWHFLGHNCPTLLNINEWGVGHTHINKRLIVDKALSRQRHGWNCAPISMLWLRLTAAAACISARCTNIILKGCFPVMVYRRQITHSKSQKQ